MSKRLRNLRIDEVSLVDRGANQEAHVKLFKRAGGDMTEAELKAATDAQAKQAKDLADAQASLKKAEDELKDLKSAGGMTSDLDTLKKQYAETEKALTKERTELQEQIVKAQKDADDARAEVAKIKQVRRRENFIKRAHELTGLPGAPADDFAEVLDAIEAGLHAVAPDKAEKYFAKFNQLLSSWNAIVAKSAILESVGRSVNGQFRGALAQMDHLAKELSAQSQSGKTPLTYEQAYAKVMQDNPELYRKHLAEKES